MTSPIRDIDAARQALAGDGGAFHGALCTAFRWADTPQRIDFWLAQYEAGRLSDEGRSALTAMVAEYEAEHGGEVAAPDPVFAEMLAALRKIAEGTAIEGDYDSGNAVEVPMDRDEMISIARAAIEKAEGRS